MLPSEWSKSWNKEGLKWNIQVDKQYNDLQRKGDAEPSVNWNGTISTKEILGRLARQHEGPKKIEGCQE
jgi:hypothetical protein